MALDVPDVLQQYLQTAWGELNPEGAAEFLHPSYRRHVAPHMPPLDRAGQVQRIAAFQAAFAEITLTLHDVVAEADRVAFRSTMQGLHSGEFAGIAPTGTQITVSLLDLIRIQDGLIIEQWGGPDLHDLMWQLRG